VTNPGKAVFLSYASQDAEAAQNLCNALRAAGIEVWFDQSELRGGDAWDHKIRREIRDCALFIPIVSHHTQERLEGYFRREWKLAIDRTLDMAEQKPFLVPVVVDGTRDQEAFVPDAFRAVQWTRLPAGETPPAFVEHVQRLLSAELSPFNSASGGTSAIREPISSTRRSTPVLLAIVAVVVCGALAYFMADRSWLSKHTPAEKPVAAAAPASTPAMPTIPERSVAVLPFVDMSEKRDQEYLSDGLSEELIDKLTNAADLKVIARTSSFQFKGKNEDIRTIGQRLGVANLLEGSVRKSGNALRITVQLVRANTGYHVWSETYDRNAGDIFKVQDEIAAAVLQALKASLLRGSTSTPTGTRNLEAYNLYLQAHAIYEHGDTAPEYKTAIEYMRRAVEADPDYAQAWAQLSDALSEQGENGYVPLDSVRRESRRAAERALELAPDLADAHVSMARFLIVDDLNLPGGEREVRRALELEPNNQWALGWAGTVAFMRGNFLGAETLLQKSIVSDPINPWRYHDLAQNYYFSGNYSEAMNTFHKVLDLVPSISDKHIFPGTVMLAQGKAQSALREIDRESDEKVRLGCNCRALALDALGRKVEADSALTYLIRNHSEEGAYGIGVVYASRRNLDEAFNWFERAFQQHDSDLLNAKVDPLLKNVQSDSRFKALLRKLGLLGEAP